MALLESVEPKQRVPAIRPSFRAERKLLREGFSRVAGVDEAGRGPLAGPVVAAAVVLDPKKLPKGLADSKLLTREKREELFEVLCALAEISVAFGSVAEIDRVNILQATLLTMRRAVRGLSAPVDVALIDGNIVPQRMPCEARPIIDGDAKCLSIAAASIVAKVMRDRLMARCDPSFSGYGLAAHKGYSTKAHQTALEELGPCRLHRRSFWRVAAFFEPVQGDLSEAWDEGEGAVPLPPAGRG